MLYSNNRELLERYHEKSFVDEYISLWGDLDDANIIHIRFMQTKISRLYSAARKEYENFVLPDDFAQRIKLRDELYDEMWKYDHMGRLVNSTFITVMAKRQYAITEQEDAQAQEMVKNLL